MTGTDLAKRDVFDTMEMKMATDCMLDKLLCDLPDAEKTVLAVERLTLFIVTDASVAKIVSNFLNKIKTDPAFLSRCSFFHKRILMFIIVQCTMVGEDIRCTFSEENLTGLEHALIRLSDLAMALENDIDHEMFCDVWMQTVKQAVLVFLKHKQTVQASRILVVYRERIVKEHREILEKFVLMCSKNHRIIETIIKEEGHDYASYFHFVCTFLRDLNSRLDKTTIHKLVEKIHTSLPNGAKPSEDEGQGSSVSDEPAEEEEIVASSSEETEDVVPLPGALDQRNITAKPGEIDINTDSGEESEQSGNEHNLGSDLTSISRLAKKQQNYKTTQKQSTTHQFEVDGRPEEEDLDSEDTDLSEDDINNDDTPVKMIPINPKNTLAYRLRKQAAASSGILIPCQHIISHCKKVNSEGENLNRSGFHFQDGPTTSTPFKARLPTYKSPVRPRELLLGDRFEEAKKAWPAANERSYTSVQRRKCTFDTELDSYIVAGCQHFSVGHWQMILRAFPFPTWCTNTKIKDRFRTLIKWQYIAMLDDGDFSVLHEGLKAKLPAAHQKRKTTEGLKRKERNVEKTAPAAKKTVQDQLKDTSNDRRKRVSVEKVSKRHRTAPQSDALTVISMTSSPSEQTTSDNTKKKPKFTAKEQGHIICGVRYFGLNWPHIKENFSFVAEVSASDIKARWHALMVKGKVTMDDEKGEVICHDSNLEKQSREAEKKLKKKIRAMRKGIPTKTNTARKNKHVTESDDSLSDVPGPSGLTQKNSKAATFEGSQSEDSDVEPLGRNPGSVKKIREELRRRRHRDSHPQSTERDREDNAESVTSRELSDDCAFNIKRHRRRHMLDSDGEAESGPLNASTSRNRLNVSTCSDAGTQTKRRKLVLGVSSPCMLDAASDMETREDKSPFEVGSPIRPSRINFFKPPTPKASHAEDARPRSKLAPGIQGLRSRRQREILRKQRRKTPAMRQPWSEAEKKELLAGLSKHGPGKWSQILDDGWEVFKDRTSVMIKDKFRGMMNNDQIPEDLLLLCKAKKAAME